MAVNEKIVLVVLLMDDRLLIHLQPKTKSLEPPLTIFRKSGSKEFDSKIAAFFDEKIIPFNVNDSQL